MPTTPNPTSNPKPAPLEPLAFRWTALDEEDATVAAFLRLNEARNWTEFTAALRAFVVPSQNFVYADVEGISGTTPPAACRFVPAATGPHRPKAGRARSEWIGWIPFEDLPHVYDPTVARHRHRESPAGSAGVPVLSRRGVPPAVPRAADHRPPSPQGRADARRLPAETLAGALRRAQIPQSTDGAARTAWNAYLRGARQSGQTHAQPETGNPDGRRRPAHD